MEVIDYLYLVAFILSLIIFFKILLDSNFAKLFKQGRISTIRVATFVVAIIGAYLLAMAIKTFVETFSKFF